MAPSYVLGSSFSLADLTNSQRQHLDQAEWVFTCNSFLSHWQSAGFRPTVWTWGDNHSAEMVRQLDVELAAIADDARLQERLRFMFVGKEAFASEAQGRVRVRGVPGLFYRRGDPGTRNQIPATTLQQSIYHYGSTFTDLVNFAAILNPGQPIYLYGNEWGDGFGHFWEGRITERWPRIWPEVKRCMWQGLRDLQDSHGYEFVDCNRHLEPLPAEFQLPTGHFP
ncbi:hypothetical protein LCGC14_0326390 [marine sediment metagenome]|uniref:Uncharacterized protein n=1 Tax=marine sediment metagenome TaxID=412755 RepID=A0A0F9U0M6_9ZZZZ